jgi:hypothetical protein
MLGWEGGAGGGGCGLVLACAVSGDSGVQVQLAPRGPALGPSQP